MVGGSLLPDYRSHLLGSSGSILAAHEITCADDETAVAKARALFEPNAFDVWRGDQRIYVAASDQQRSHHLQQARHWRAKAEDCRIVAKQMQTPAAQATFSRMGETYDELASGVEERAARLLPESPGAG
jgi:hypothetical protein